MLTWFSFSEADALPFSVIRPPAGLLRSHRSHLSPPFRTFVTSLFDPNSTVVGVEFHQFFFSRVLSFTASARIDLLKSSPTTVAGGLPHFLFSK